MKDRTSEFFAAANSISSRSTNGPISHHSESHRTNANNNISKTEFAKAASTIGKELNATMIKLQKLATLAKNKSLFDDNPIEINELIYIINQDIAKVRRQISTLQNYVNQNKGTGELGNRQVEEHSSHVLFSLESKLATTSKEFQNALEVRNKNLKEQKSRKEEYSSGMVGPPGITGSSSSNSAQQQQSSLSSGATSGQNGINMAQSFSDSPLYFPDKKTGSNMNLSNNTSQSMIPSEMRHRNVSQPGNNDQSSDTVIDFGGDDFGFQQQSLMQNSANMEIVESRAQAIESIESTIAELGQIYQHFATLLSSQREVVQRIDDNIQDTEINVVGAHNQLLKYYQNISSNRWLMLKVFATMIFFTLIFVLFLN